MATFVDFAAKSFQWRVQWLAVSVAVLAKNSKQIGPKMFIF